MSDSMRPGMGPRRIDEVRRANRRKRVRVEKTLGCLFGLFWIFCVLLSLAITVGTIVVAIHFIVKYW